MSIIFIIIIIIFLLFFVCFVDKVDLHYCILYSRKFLRTLNFAVFEDFVTASKIILISQNLIIVYMESYGI